MRFIARLIVRVIGNGIGLFLAGHFIPGVHILTTDPISYLIAAAILTALNMLIKPLLTLLFGPVILITLGFGLIIVNAIIFALLDFLSTDITIDTITALVLTSLVIGAVNMVFSLATKKE